VAQGARSSHRGSLRIIGGAWRSRRLEFPESPGLRPTPDRVRETVFNWLAPYLPGATCLDLFAGSGAFGFEALSRGAARVVFVEKNTEAIAALRRNGELLRTTQAEIAHADALVFLNGPVAAFDIVFLDPPYASGLLASCLQRLAVGEWVKPGGLVYLENREGEAVMLPAGWRMLRSKTAGQVGYHLARKNENQETP